MVSNKDILNIENNRYVEVFSPQYNVVVMKGYP